LRSSENNPLTASAAVAKTKWQPHVAAIMQVERIVHTFKPATGLWKSSIETALYLSSRAIEAKRAASAIRAHWAIENKSPLTIEM
jgi:predicted transposase YbfD/YdcC